MQLAGNGAVMAGLFLFAAPALIVLIILRTRDNGAVPAQRTRDKDGPTTPCNQGIAGIR